MLQGSFEGTWESSLGYINGEGLRDADWHPDFWRLVIQNNSVRVFFRRSGATDIEEVKPGKYRIETFLTNAIVFSLDSGSDSDGVWVETEAFLLTQLDENLLGATLAGAVNNTAQPTSIDTSKFFYVATGKFSRV